MSNPRVSIIIVNWNGGKVFDECLFSLSKVNYKSFDLIIVDNASTDKSEYLHKKYFSKVKLIKNRENIGFANANNQAIKYAKGRYVLLLNNDTKVTPNFLKKLVNRMEQENELGVIQPKIYMMDRGKYLDNAGSFLTKIGFLDHWGFNKKDSKEFGIEKYIFSAKGACMLIRKEVIEKVNLFDPKFISYFEESDFCWKVWLVGFRVLFYPEAHIYHKVGFTIKRQNVLELNFHYYKNRIRSLTKNLSYINLILILIPHLFISVGIAAAFLLRGSLKNFLMIQKAIFWNLLNLSDSWKQRKKIQNLRIISDTEIFENVGKNVDIAKFFDDFRRVENDMKVTN